MHPILTSGYANTLTFFPHLSPFITLANCLFQSSFPSLTVWLYTYSRKTILKCKNLSAPVHLAVALKRTSVKLCTPPMLVSTNFSHSLLLLPCTFLFLSVSIFSLSSLWKSGQTQQFIRFPAPQFLVLSQPLVPLTVKMLVHHTLWIMWNKQVTVS